MKSMQDLKILFVQIRRDAMKDQEYRCVIEKSELRPDQVVSFDIFERLIQPSDLDGYDALLVGASGEFCLSKNEIPDQNAAIAEVVREAKRRSIPTIGVCYGAQLMAYAFGGSVEQDRSRQEVGTYDIVKSEHANQDPIMQHLPPVFLAQEGHKDHIVQLPPGAVHLCKSALSQHQGFTFPGERVYGFQLHFELDRQGLMERLNYYKDQYLHGVQVEKEDVGAASTNTEFDEIMARTFDTPDAARILRLFLEEIVQKQRTYPGT